MKGIILARVSTTRQEKEGLSLEEIQLPTLRDYAAKKNIEIDKEFVFNETANQKTRTKFNEMLEYIKKHTDIKHLICFRVDRISRNFRDAVLADDLIKEYDKEIHFVNDGFSINKNSTGREIQDWDFRIFMGKQHINRGRDDAINSAKAKLEKGEISGPAPFGYKNISLDRRNKWVELDETKAPIVKFIFDKYSTGTVSMLALTKKIKEEFNLTISKSQVEKILKRKFYYGIIEYKDKEYPHSYDTLITEDIYNIVQEVKVNNGQKGKGIKHGKLPFIYQGFIKCSICGSSMSPEQKKNKYHYYKCTQHYKKHDVSYVKEEDITKQISQAYKQVQLSKDDLKHLTKSIRNAFEDKKQNTQEFLTLHQVEYKKATNRIEMLWDDKYDGKITEDQHEKRLKRYQEQQAKAKAKLDSLEKADNHFYLLAENILSLISRAGEIYESSELEQKRELLRMSFQNLKLDGSKLVYDWTETFEKVSLCSSRLKWQG